MKPLACRAVVAACILSFAAASAAAPPPRMIAPVTFRPEIHTERQHDPYIPADPAAINRFSTRSIITRGPYTSYQVNVNGLGANIPGDAANEPSLAIDPTNPQRMVIGWRQFDTILSNFRQAGRAYTTDGGLTWTNPGVFTPGVFRSDPVISEDSAGRIFYNSLQGTFLCDMFITTDGGMTWSGAIPAFGGDKQWMDIDKTGGMGDGHIYVAWSENAGCCGTNVFTRSTDHGLTYLTPIGIPQRPVFGTVAVGPDGEVYVCGMRQIDGAIVVAKSVNAQNAAVTPTFVQSVVVNLGGFQAFGGVNPAGLLGQIWVAVNHAPGAFRGHVYLMASVVPIGGDPLDVYFARSTDGGLSWSPPRRINDDPRGNGAWQWFATMSVSPGGRIDAIWNDTRGSPAATESELYYSYSCDDGVTWTANAPVSPAFDQSLGYPQQDKLGDYYDMISDDGGANVAYAATFNGEQDVYFLRIPFTSDCNTNGTADSIDLTVIGAVNCQPDCLPDECQLGPTDCNTNQTPDGCDLAAAFSRDCQLDGIPDECQLAGNDCDTNTTPDECDIAAGAADCQTDGVPDRCQLGPSDCNTNNTPDNCETDCNTNIIADLCELAGADCNTNLALDVCDMSDPQTIVSANPPQPGALALLTGGLDNYLQVTAANGPQVAEDFTVAGPTVLTDIQFEAIECPDPGMPFDGTIEVALHADAGGRPSVRPAHTAVIAAIKTRLAAVPGGPPALDLFRYAASVPVNVRVPAAGTWWVSARPRTNAANPLSRLAWSQSGTGVTGAAGRWRPDRGKQWIADSLVPVLTSSDAHGFAMQFNLVADCNSNGAPDECDAAFTPGGDANSDAIPDACQDCNTNGAPDPTEGLPDCNSNRMPDVCDVLLAGAADCNSNLVPDFCEPDCNTDGDPDACQAELGDCNTNMTLDRCERDCDTNGSADVCDNLRDCNTNGTGDVCDLNPIAIVRVDELNVTDGVPGHVTSDDELLNTSGNPAPPPAPARFLVADDFTLVAGTQFTGITFRGLFHPAVLGADACSQSQTPAEPPFGDLEFTIKWWSHNGVNSPNLLIRTDVISAASGRLSRLGDRYFLRLATPFVPGGSGRRWVEIYYSGPSGIAVSGGNFQVAVSRNDLNLSRVNSSTTVPEAPWTVASSSVQMVFGLLGRSSVLDADTNGTPDECDAAGPICTAIRGDMDRSGGVNGIDVPCFVDCFIAGATNECPNGDGCACADMDADGDRDACDLCLFVQAALGLPAGVCSPAPCP